MQFSRPRVQSRYVILPPAKATVPDTFCNPQMDNRLHDHLMAAMQRFRGGIYAAEGAISKTELTSDGRHRMAIDEESWHVLSMDDQNRVVACVRFLDESQKPGFHQLLVKHAAIARCPEFGASFRHAIEDRMQNSRRQGLRFGEVGGWAVAEDHRWTLEPLRVILATYGLLELLGGCAGVATATFRHSSAVILRRIGLSAIQSEGCEMPPYFDPGYGCQMQVLEFDSRRPAAKYRDWVRELSGLLRVAPVIGRERQSTPLEGVLRGFDMSSPAQLIPLQA
jgi:hypothetical protein